MATWLWTCSVCGAVGEPPSCEHFNGWTSDQFALATANLGTIDEDLYDRIARVLEQYDMHDAADEFRERAGKTLSGTFVRVKEP